MPPVICFTEPSDGKLCVVSFSESLRRTGESDAQFLTRMAVKDLPVGVTFLVTNDSTFPDPVFADAWVIQSGAVVIDMTRAREFYRGKLLQERNAALESYDAAWVRAYDEDDVAKLAEIKAKRKALRKLNFDSMPKILQDAATPDALKAIKLEDLLK